MTITPNSLSLLPGIEVIRRSWQAVAMFDAIAERDENWRVCRFKAHWHSGAAFGFIDTRQGDCIRGALLDNRAILRGYNESSPLANEPLTTIDDAVASVHSGVPTELRRYLRHRDFDCGGATFCIWRTPGSRTWRGVEPMYSSETVKSHPLEFLDLLTGDPDPFMAWVRAYYERDDLDEVIRTLYQHSPLCEAAVQAISKSARRTSVLEAANAIGYPVRDAAERDWRQNGAR